MKRVLVVEPDTVQRTAITRSLESNGFTPWAINDLAPEQEIDLDDVHVAVANTALPSGPGLLLTRRLGSIPLILIADIGCIREAVEAIRQGAADYIARPFEPDHLIAAIELTHGRASETRSKPAGHGGRQHLPHMLGSCAGMRELFERIRKVAPTESTVLIQGESGTGKELVARAIHGGSLRVQAPMISLNCAAIPESLIESELFGHERGAFTGASSSRSGLIEAAHGGTLFLDEIGELPLEAQARLLRVLQEGEIRRVGSTQTRTVDVRLIAATHRDLRRLTETGHFREDLFYRLNVVTLRVPPLRERGTDVLDMASAMLRSMCDKFSKPGLNFSQSALAAMRAYHWPGNVRELENAIERAVILCEGLSIEPELLAIDYPPRRPDSAVSPVEQEAATSLEDYFVRFVLEHQDHLTETEIAQKLGISRKSLWERRQRLNIPRRRTRQRGPRRNL
jgi:two-component system, NtrC family, response regulator HydG